MTNIIKNRNADPAAFGSVLDQLFPKKVTSLLDDAFWGFNSPSTLAVPPVNIRETAEAYELELSAPGLQKCDFQIKIEGDTLTVSFGHEADQEKDAAPAEGQSIQKQDNTQSRWVRREFTRQSFQRHFELGDTLDRDRISASYDNGILRLILPKKENVRPAFRQIEIS